jgi:Mg-chelatase subunit ChlD
MRNHAQHRRPGLLVAAWLAFAGVVAVLAWLLLAACEMRLPWGAQIGFCAGSTPTAYAPDDLALRAAQDRGDELARRLHDRRMALLATPACAPEPPAPEPETAGPPPRCPAKDPSEVIMVFDTSGSMNYNLNLPPRAEQELAALYRKRDALMSRGIMGKLAAAPVDQQIGRITRRLENMPGTDRIQVAKPAAVNLIGSLPDKVSTTLLTFGQECGQVRRLGPIGASKRDALRRHIAGLVADGTTPLADAIQAVTQVADGGKSADKPVNVVVVTDGFDSCQRDPCAAAKAVKRALPHSSISVIAASRNLRPLRCIAEIGGGLFMEPRSSEAFARAVRQAAGQGGNGRCKSR